MQMCQSEAQQNAKMRHKWIRVVRRHPGSHFNVPQSSALSAISHLCFPQIWKLPVSPPSHTNATPPNSASLRTASNPMLLLRTEVYRPLSNCGCNVPPVPTQPGNIWQAAHLQMESRLSAYFFSLLCPRQFQPPSPGLWYQASWRQPADQLCGWQTAPKKIEVSQIKAAFWRSVLSSKWDVEKLL